MQGPVSEIPRRLGPQGDGIQSLGRRRHASLDRKRGSGREDRPPAEEREGGLFRRRSDHAAGAARQHARGERKPFRA